MYNTGDLRVSFFLRHMNYTRIKEIAKQLKELSAELDDAIKETQIDILRQHTISLQHPYHMRTSSNNGREPWDSPLDDEQSSTEQESGDILFEDEPRINLSFTKYKG